MSSECAREPKQQDGAVAKLAERGALATDHAKHDVTGCRFLANRRGANRAPDPGQDGLDLLIARGGFEPGGPVEVADGRQASSKGAGSPPAGSLIRQEATHHFWRGGQRGQAPFLAPALEYAPVAPIRRQRGLGLTRASEVGCELKRRRELHQRPRLVDYDKRVSHCGDPPECALPAPTSGICQVYTYVLYIVKNLRLGCCLGTKM